LTLQIVLILEDLVDIFLIIIIRLSFLYNDSLSYVYHYNFRN